MTPGPNARGGSAPSPRSGVAGTMEQALTGADDLSGDDRAAPHGSAGLSRAADRGQTQRSAVQTALIVACCTGRVPSLNFTSCIHLSPTRITPRTGEVTAKKTTTDRPPISKPTAMTGLDQSIMPQYPIGHYLLRDTPALASDGPCRPRPRQLGHLSPYSYTFGGRDSGHGGRANHCRYGVR